MGLEPIVLNGKKYYAMFVYPGTHYLLKVCSARYKWYHSQWVKRFNRWRLSRGELPYQEVEAEIGTYDGFSFVGT